MKKILMLITMNVLVAATLHVPQDYPNIQNAIMFASHSDTVLVAPGTYSGQGNFDINFYGKAIHLLGDSGYENTIIDLEDENRGFYFNSLEDSTSIVEGFKIYRGRVEQYEGMLSEDYGYGGAVYIGDAGPKFINCKFESNDAYRKGDAVSIRNGGFPIFENCLFKDNEWGSGDRQGGAMEIHNSSAIIRNTEFQGNGNDSEYDGGAIYIHSNNENNEDNVEITNCQFLENGTNNGNTYGGAIYLSKTGLDIQNSYFYDNDANNQGGAIYIASNTYNNTYISNSIFDYNGRGVDEGGAIYKYQYGDTLFVNQSTFIRNGWSTNTGGAIYLNRTKAVINNTEITRNHSSNDGAGIYVYGDWNENYFEMNFSTVTHNYSYGNYNTRTSIDFENDNLNAVVNNSIINYTTSSGANNDNIEFTNTYTDGYNQKLFLDSYYSKGNFKLASHSPALGYGVVDDRFPLDRDGNPRINPDGSNPDVGCYESTRSQAESGNTVVYVSPDGDDLFGSGEIDNPYKSIYLGIRATYPDWSDTVRVANGMYNEDDFINFRGRRVYIQSENGSEETVVIFPGNLGFTNENLSYTSSINNGLYTNTIDGLDIRINNSTEYGIYMYDQPIHFIDVIIEDEIYSEKTSFNIDGLKSYTNEGFTNGLIRLYNLNDNEDFTYNFNNLDIIANGGNIIYMYNDYNSNGRDMNVNVSNSSLRAGSSGSNDVFNNGCCNNYSNDDRINIEYSFIEGDVQHRGLRDFTAIGTVFKNTRFDISEDNGNNYTEIENCTVINGEFNTDAQGIVKNTIFYPNIQFDNYSNQSNLHQTQQSHCQMQLLLQNSCKGTFF